MHPDLRTIPILLLAIVFEAGTAARAVPQAALPLPGARFENWLFSAPPGWDRREDADGLIVTSPDGQASLRLVPGESLSSAGLDSWLAGQLVLLERDLTLERAEERKSTPTGEHYEWLVWPRVLNDRQGRLLARTYFAANPRARAELLVFTARDWESFKRYLPTLESFIDSVQFANVRGIPKPVPRPMSPIPAPSVDSLGRLGLTAERLKFEPIPDEFRCYVRTESDDYSTPDFLVQILSERQYRTADGTGTYTVAANPTSGTGRIEWRSGPLATPSGAVVASFGTVGWQDDGQLLLMANAPLGRNRAARDANCYQRGAREARAQEAFRQIDPRPGSYPCVTRSGRDSAGTLVILPGRRYRYSGVEGAYSVDIMDSQLGKTSSLKFHGGPFQFGSGTYGTYQGGTQSYTVSAKVSLECAA
jgi:hypothetical protein